MMTVGMSAQMLIGLVLLSLPILPVVRPAVWQLLRKGYPGSATAAAVARIRGRRSTAWTRTTILDVGLMSAVASLPTLAMLAEGPSVLDVGLFAVLLALALFDLRLRLLPDGLTLPLLLAGVPVALSTTGDVLAAVIAGVVTYALAFLVAWIFRQMRGEEGLGGGDLKLMAAVAIWLGPAQAPVAIVLAAVAAIAAEAVVALVTGGYDRRRLIPFGAYLAGGFWLVWCVTRPPAW